MKEPRWLSKMIKATELWSVISYPSQFYRKEKYEKPVQWRDHRLRELCHETLSHRFATYKDIFRLKKNFYSPNQLFGKMENYQKGNTNTKYKERREKKKKRKRIEANFFKMMTTWHSSLTKVGGLFSFWEARKKSTLGMAGDWEAAVRGAGWGQRYSTDSTWRDNQLGQKCKQNSSLGSKREKCNIPITRTPEFHFSRVSSFSHANKRSSYPTKNLKIANCEPIKLIIIYYFHHHLHHHEKISIRIIPHPHHPGKHNPPF